MLLIDTNIFLEIMLAQSKRGACVKYLNAVKTGKQEAAVTDFSLYSIMIILDGRGKLLELNRFLRSLSAYKGLMLYGTSLQDKVDAIQLAADGEFDVDDAVQYASATRLRVKAIVSLDRDFDDREIPRRDPGEIDS